jgi:hypothetical protein
MANIYDDLHGHTFSLSLDRHTTYHDLLVCLLYADVKFNVPVTVGWPKCCPSFPSIHSLVYLSQHYQCIDSSHFKDCFATQNMTSVFGHAMVVVFLSFAS